MALAGKDLVAVAKTGSGKTLAYMIPCVTQAASVKARMPAGYRAWGPLALVLVPTRELATQVIDRAALFATASGLTMAAVFGGVPKEHQLAALDGGIDVLVATPGRLAEFVECGRVGLGLVSFLALDEADRMLDMGFAPQVSRLVGLTPVCRQSVLVSASWPNDVAALADRVCGRGAAKVFVGRVCLAVNRDIDQTVMVLAESDKRKRLLEVLKAADDGHQKVLVFVRTKKGCDRISRQLLQTGHRAVAIHGDKQQEVGRPDSRTARPPLTILAGDEAQCW
jgi:superfamily II DNA/RNA helicase